MKILGWGENLCFCLGENFEFGQQFKVETKILGSGKNYWSGQKIGFQVKNFGFRRKFWVWAKILGLGENFWFERKF